MRPLIVLTAAVAAAFVLAQASEGLRDPTAAAVRGAELASKWCVQCHFADPQPDTIPTFAGIVQRRTDAQIAAFLQRPHGAMPPVSLSRQQIVDVVAYLGTLRAQGPLALPVNP